jgi:hypothetical protein
MADHDATAKILEELAGGVHDSLILLGEASEEDFAKLFELELGSRKLVELTKIVYTMEVNYKYEDIEDIELEEEQDLAKAEIRIVRKAWRREIRRRKVRRQRREAALRAAAAIEEKDKSEDNEDDVDREEEEGGSRDGDRSHRSGDGDGDGDGDDNGSSVGDGGGSVGSLNGRTDEESSSRRQSQISLASSVVNLDEVDFEDFFEADEEYEDEDEDDDLDDFSSGPDDDEEEARFRRGSERGSAGDRRRFKKGGLKPEDVVELERRHRQRAQWLQLRERKLDLEAHVLVLHSAIGLARYRAKSELLLKKLHGFRPFRRLGQMESEGVFFDVVYEHVNVIDRCIVLAGGWRTALHMLIVSLVADNL